MIATLEGKYRFLSNFWSCVLEWDGVVYSSVENAYQACKCANPYDRAKFLYIKASEAKRLGRIIPIRANWNDLRLDIMLRLVRRKFEDPKLASLLLETGAEEIQEGNWWGDTFWGTVNGVGENHLGLILMQVRDEVKVTKRTKIVNYQLSETEPLT